MIYINKLQSQLKGNDSLRVKAFLYDIVTDKVIEAKLQEFSMPIPKQSSTPSATARITTVQNPKTQRILLSVNNKVAEANYNPKTGIATAKLDVPQTDANHPLAAQLPQNADMRVKVFIYDFIKDKILGAKLQEFELNIQTFDYHATDEIVSTVPVILGNWDKKGLVERAKKEQKIEKVSQVKTVELVTELENGSANDGSRKNIQKGMVYGKNYTFKVIEFTDEKPKNQKNIKWNIKYHNLTLNKWEEVALKNNGIEITIHMNNLEMCGRFIYIRAYLNDKKVFGEAKIWMHNRFRWIDRMILKSEIALRNNSPDLADQKSTPLCGMASIMYLLAKKDFNLYNDFVLNLHKKGFFKVNDYSVDINNSLHLLEVNPETNKKYPNNSKGKMAYCDWITFSLVRNQENSSRDYDGLDDPEIDGATLPGEIVKLMKDLLNFKKVIDYTNLFTNKGTMPWDGEFSSIRELAKMQELRNKGYEIVMLVNTNMLNGKVSGEISFPEHLIVYEGFANKTISPEIYEFNVFSWGSIMQLKLIPDIFGTNFYGYVYGK